MHSRVLHYRKVGCIQKAGEGHGPARLQKVSVENTGIARDADKPIDKDLFFVKCPDGTRIGRVGLY